MKILAVADEESKYLWEYYEPSKLRDIDLIIGCGDLSLHYMNFLSDAAPVPVLYVHGNHDASYDKEPPRGAICIDDDLYWYKGYRIVGLGGSCRVYDCHFDSQIPGRSLGASAAIHDFVCE